MRTKIFPFIRTCITLFLIAFSLMAFSQSSAPPPPPGGSTGSGDGTGGSTDSRNGAPLSGGIGMLLTLGVAYGGKKYYDYRKRLKNEIQE
ncbi:MAG: hypothetical protein K9J27_11140 [Bacteroidales bacterium]|nr:hypothetical protein [Bacteroidales bacterium]MCF8334346.1 hypothetical protein [Bacteroidales bacterium]